MRPIFRSEDRVVVSTDELPELLAVEGADEDVVAVALVGLEPRTEAEGVRSGAEVTEIAGRDRELDVLGGGMHHLLEVSRLPGVAGVEAGDVAASRLPDPSVAGVSETIDAVRNDVGSVLVGSSSCDSIRLVVARHDDDVDVTVRLCVNRGHGLHEILALLMARHDDTHQIRPLRPRRRLHPRGVRSLFARRIYDAPTGPELAEHVGVRAIVGPLPHGDVLDAEALADGA